MVHSDPRRLIGRVTFLGQTYNFLVGHGPHRAHDEQSKTQWWAETMRLCRTLQHDAAWILLMDGNCRLGSVVSECVGDHQADPEDSSGAAMHELLHATRAWLPCTFEAYMQGDGGTLFQKMTQQLQRSDYIGIPAAWRDWCLRSFVEPSISAGHAVPDHFATVVECQALLAGPSARAKARKIDPAAIMDPTNHQKVVGILAAAPQIRWEVNVNDHASALANTCTHLLWKLSRSALAGCGLHTSQRRPVLCTRLLRGCGRSCGGACWLCVMLSFDVPSKPGDLCTLHSKIYSFALGLDTSDR